MISLLVLGFPYPTTGHAAAQEILLQEPDFAAGPDNVAVVSRDDAGAFHVTTNHTPGGGGRSLLWHLLLTALILPEDRAGPAHDLAALSDHWPALGVDGSFGEQVREMLAPDTSALFLLATEPVSPDALTALGRFGGRLLAAPLVPDIDARIANALARATGPATPPRGEMHPDDERGG